MRLNRDREFVRLSATTRLLTCASGSGETDLLATTPSTLASGGASGTGTEAMEAAGAFTPPQTSDRPWLDSNPILRALNPANAPIWLRPLLFALLGLSIALLLTGAMPVAALPAGPMSVMVVRNRALMVGAGITLLLIVATITTLS